MVGIVGNSQDHYSSKDFMYLVKKFVFLILIIKMKYL
jgi:hypothetical protein